MIITTNIRLPSEKLKELKLLAIHSGTTVSGLLREAVDWLLQNKGSAVRSPSAERKTTQKDPFYDAVGIGAGGPSDDSVRHDFYLYGKK